MDEAAADMGIDPVNSRLINGVEKGYKTKTGLKVTRRAMKDALEAAADEIGWDDKKHHERIKA